MSVIRSRDYFKDKYGVWFVNLVLSCGHTLKRPDSRSPAGHKMYCPDCREKELQKK